MRGTGRLVVRSRRLDMTFGVLVGREEVRKNAGGFSIWVFAWGLR